MVLLPLDLRGVGARRGGGDLLGRAVGVERPVHVAPDALQVGRLLALGHPLDLSLHIAGQLADRGAGARHALGQGDGEGAVGGARHPVLGHLAGCGGHQGDDRDAGRAGLARQAAGVAARVVAAGVEDDQPHRLRARQGLAQAGGFQRAGGQGRLAGGDGVLGQQVVHAVDHRAVPGVVDHRGLRALGGLFEGAQALEQLDPVGIGQRGHLEAQLLQRRLHQLGVLGRVHQRRHLVVLRDADDQRDALGRPRAAGERHIDRNGDGDRRPPSTPLVGPIHPTHAHTLQHLHGMILQKRQTTPQRSDQAEFRHIPIRHPHRLGRAPKASSRHGRGMPEPLAE